jgi:hypothetical protein
MLAIINVNLLRRWGRTTLTCVGVAVGVTTVVALLAVTGGLSRSAGDLAKLGRADFGVFQAGLADLTASSLPDSIVPRIEATPGVAAVSPVQIVSGDSSILLFGAQPQSFLTGRLVLVAGHAPRGAQLFVGSAAASRLHTTPGRVLVVKGRALSARWPASIVPASRSRTPVSSCSSPRRRRSQAAINELLKQIIDAGTEPWGINVVKVETKDVDLPDAMKRAMARGTRAHSGRAPERACRAEG